MSTSTAVLEPYNNWPNDPGFDAPHEEPTPVELKVIGDIPAYAAGVLYRTGPQGYKIDTEKGSTILLSHWFDGINQVHRFEIIPSDDKSSPARVLYNSRRTFDRLLETARKTGNYDHFTFGQKRDPRKGFLSNLMTVFKPAFPSVPWSEDGLNTNIGVTISVNPPGLTKTPDDQNGHASGVELWTTTDTARYARLDPETLQPLGFALQTSLSSKLGGPFSASRGKSDPVTGDVFNYNLLVSGFPLYKIFQVSAATGKTTILAKIRDAPAAYIHSLTLTENYVVFCVWAGHYSYHGLPLLWKRNMIDGIGEFDPSKPTKWYVIDRKHGKGVVAQYDGDPFFCFNTINAWEEPSPSDPSRTDIVVDLSTYANLDILKKYYYDNLVSTSPIAREFIKDKGVSTRATIRRWRLPSITSGGTSSSKSGRAMLDFAAPRDRSCELPTVNPRFLTKPSRYIYGVIDRGHSTFFDGLVKFDAQTQTAIYWQEHGHSPGDAVFLPNPDGTEEDDGILLSIVLDGIKEKSYLLVLDAKTLKEKGRAIMESVVGFGYHGTHTAAGTT